MATPTRRTPLEPAAAGGAGGRGRGGRGGSAVGEPGRGAAVLSQAPQGRGAAGRGAVAPAGPVAPPATPSSPALAPVPFGGVDPVYAVGADGFLHTLRSSNGSDAEPPAPFLPPSARASSLLFVDGVVYAATSGECGAAPDAVWAIDLTTKEHKVSSWKTDGGPVAGSGGMAFGPDGTIYAAIGANHSRRGSSRPDATANAVVSLDRQSLGRKDWFSAEGADFSASPLAFRYKDRTLVAVSGDDGRLYLLDGSALGGADHKTPLHATAVFSAPGAGGGLATWEDQGTRWILAPTAASAAAARGRGAAPAAASGSVTAFRLVDRNGTLGLERVWTSRPLISPLAPIVVNGIAFVASSGEFRGGPRSSLSAVERARRSSPAILYALDATTGKELWNSGATMTSFARAGLSAGAGQVYVVTYDNTLYAFGIPMEH